jgi:hypothetical protein
MGARAGSDSSGWRWVVIGICLGIAAVTAALAFVFRLREQPRERVVQAYSDWPEPPVIHAREKR